MTELRLGAIAVADVRGARRYYDEVQEGLSRGFAESLDELFARLRAFPRSAPRVAGYDDVHRAVVREFPYVVFYRHRGERIDVRRVLHAARDDAAQGPE